MYDQVFSNVMKSMGSDATMSAKELLQKRNRVLLLVMGTGSYFEAKGGQKSCHNQLQDFIVKKVSQSLD